MASSSSLLGLVNQLHGIETQFSRVLMEAAMKVAYFMDFNLFLMIETPDGRSWVGRNRLKEEFLGSGLRVGSSDVQFEVDAGVSALVQQPTMAQVQAAVDRSMEGRFGARFYDGGDVILVDDPSPISPPVDAVSTTPSSGRRKRGANSVLWKRRESDSKRQRLTTNPAADSPSSTTVSPANLVFGSLFNVDDVVSAVGTDEDVASPVAMIDVKPEVTTAPDASAVDAGIDVVDSAELVAEMVRVSGEKLGFLDGFETLDLSDKTNYVYKLVSSAGYDVAKLLATVCPYKEEYKGPRVNKWVNEMFEEWILNFPILTKHKTIIKNLFVGKNFRKARLRVLRKDGYQIPVE